MLTMMCGLDAVGEQVDVVYIQSYLLVFLKRIGYPIWKGCFQYTQSILVQFVISQRHSEEQQNFNHLNQHVLKKTSSQQFQISNFKSAKLFLKYTISIFQLWMPKKYNINRFRCIHFCPLVIYFTFTESRRVFLEVLNCIVLILPLYIFWESVALTFYITCCFWIFGMLHH